MAGRKLWLQHRRVFRVGASPSQADLADGGPKIENEGQRTHLELSQRRSDTFYSVENGPAIGRLLEPLS